MLPTERTRIEASLPTGSNPSPRVVGLFSTFYWPEVRRGTERLVHDLAAGLPRAGWAPVIVAGHAQRTRRDHEGGVEVVRVRRRPTRIAGALGYTEPLGHLPGVWREVRRRSWTVLHAFGTYESSVAALAARGRHDASVLTVPGIPQQAMVDGLFWRRRALHKAVASSDVIVVISEAARNALGWLGGDQRVIHPGVDLEAFVRTRERAESPTVLCTAAIDDPRKRVPLVVDAFRDLRRRWPEARLILSTRAGERPPSAEPGVEYRVLDSHEALTAAYSEAWTSVLASTAEAFGLVAVESLACGTPVVASDDAGIVEAVGATGGQAELFHGDRSDDLARAMAAGLERAGDPVVERDCLEQASKFSLPRFLNAHIELYDELS